MCVPRLAVNQPLITAFALFFWNGRGLSADMDSFDAAGVTGIIWRRVDPAREAEAEAIMEQLMVVSRGFEGFLGSEIFPPIPGVQDAYVVLYRYARGENLRRWLDCARRRELLEKMEGFLREPAREFYFAHRRREPGTASSVFSYRIRPERLAEFNGWRRRILEEARKWEGFLGTESFDTLDSDRGELVVVVRFNNRVNLDAWLSSPARAVFMREVSEYVEHYRLRRMGSGFEGWFDTSRDKKPPAAWRQGMVVLVALFPVIMILRRLLAPLFAILPLPEAFLILLTIDIAVLTYVVMPRFSRLMNFWLHPGPQSTWRTELVGWGILLGLLAGTLAASLCFG
jgi:antibiotic biosynthesis monooxygenase (ABM) superfamily enzyme